MMMWMMCMKRSEQTVNDAVILYITSFLTSFAEYCSKYRK